MKLQYKMRMFYFVYVLQNSNDKSLYIGFTKNLNQRNKRDALEREKFLKGGSGRKYLKKQLRYYWDDK
jgi:predicted GIY-YIG superfamily endonuclease